MAHSSSTGKSGSNVRVRLFQPGNDEHSETDISLMTRQNVNMDEQNNGDMEMLVSDSEFAPEDGRRMSTADGGNNIDTPLVASAFVPVEDSSVPETHVGRLVLLDNAEATTESFFGNNTLEFDTESLPMLDMGTLNRSSPGGFADERDPNYATQRPDTLGAITIAEVTQGNIASGVQLRYGSQAPILRARVADSTAEGASFADSSGSGLRLGRRTRGAGMDQVELNQRYMFDDDGDDHDDDGNPSENDNEGSEGNTASDLGDEDDDENRLRDANQCESTEADQYKMEPEVDQSDGGDLTARTRSSSAGSHLEAAAAASLSIGSVRGPSDHRNRSDRAGQDNGNASAESRDVFDVDKAEEDQAPLPVLRQMSGNGHSSRVGLVNQSHSNVSSICEPDGASKRGPVVQPLAHPQPAISSVVKLSAVAGAKPGQNAIAKMNAGSVDVGASAFKPVSSVRTLVPEVSASVTLASKAVGKPTAGKSSAAPSQEKTQHISRNTSVPLPSHSKQNSSIPGLKMHDEHSSSVAAVSSQLTVVTEFSVEHQPESETSSQRLRTQRRVEMQPVGADMRHASYGVAVSRGVNDRINLDRLEGSGPEPPSNGQGVFFSASDYAVHSMGRTAFTGGLAANYLRDSPQASASFVPGDSSSQQATPVRVHSRLPHQLLDDSLEMSPIRPASSAGSQQTSLHGFDTASGRGDFAPFQNYGHNYGRQVNIEQTFSEINEMEDVRGQLNQLLLLSDCNIPDRAIYDHMNDDVDDLLTSRPVGHRSDPSLYSHSGPPSLSALHDALPLSSKFLMHSAVQSVPTGLPKPDPAALLAENHALRDAMEQQRFKLKHCEKQIQLLQTKVLELQQNLAVSVSTERKKDVMIEHLDKALYKVVEGWKQKEAERQDVVHRLQLDKNALQHAVDSQQQVVTRFERQLKQTLSQLHAEQQRAIGVCNEKDHQLDEVHKECERLQDELNKEKDQCRRLIDAEKRDVLVAKDKMQVQIAQLKAAHEEENSIWESKEREYLQKIDNITDGHLDAVEHHKTQMEKQKQLYAEMQSALKTTQMQVEKVQLELDTTMRERESLKVELSLAEARLESSKRKLEAELQMEAERQLSARLDEAMQRQADAERRIHDTHRKHIQDIAHQHRSELQNLAEEHDEALKWLEEKNRQDNCQRDERIQDLEREILALEADNKRIQARNLEVTYQLQSMMQSHCSEALRLLQHANLLVPSSVEMMKDGNHLQSVVNGGSEKTDLGLPATVAASTSLPTLTPAVNKPSTLENTNELVRHQQPAVEQPFSPPVSMSSNSSSALFSASNHISTQYTQFLESVRGFQPLLADLNASIASVTNSVSTVGLSVGGGHGGSGVAGGQPDGNSSVWLHSPVVLRSSMDAVSSPDSAEDSPESRGNFQHDSGPPVVGSTTVNGGHNTLLSRILQQDLSGLNSSSESMDVERYAGGSGSVGNASRLSASSSDRLRQHEMRQQELSHYIRVLLQKSPGTTETDDYPTSDAVNRGQQMATNGSDSGSAINGSIQNQVHSSKRASPKPYSIDPSMKLTSQQIDDLEQMIALHRAASVAAESSMHTDATRHHGTNGRTHEFEPSIDRPSSPTKEVRRGRMNALDDPHRASQHGSVISSDNDSHKAPVKQCRQTNSTALSTETGVGPGRPDLQNERQTRQAKQDNCSKNSKPPLTTNGVTLKKADRKVTPSVISGTKNSSRSSAWK